MLPAEIIDLIFSFLQKDRAALKSCSAAHPLLSSLAERHLFDHLILYTTSQVPPGPIDGFLVSQLSRRLSERPYLATHIQSVTIDGRLGPASYNIFDELSTLLPLMTHSEGLSLRNLRWSSFPDKFRSALLSFLQKTHIRELYLQRTHNFPLTLLSNLKNIKTLEIDFSRCSFKHAHQITSLESLSLANVTLVEYTKWADLGLKGLISLHSKLLPLPDLSLIFSACSTSLTTLTLEIGTLYQTKYRSRSSVSIPLSGFLFNLTSLPSLELITIHVKISAKTTAKGTGETPNTTSCDSSLPAITQLIRTAGPSLKRAVLNLGCTVGVALDLRDAVEWGPLVLLCDSCQHLRVDLRIRASTVSRPQLSFVEVVHSLGGNEELSMLVERGSLAINQFS